MNNASIIIRNTAKLRSVLICLSLFMAISTISHAQELRTVEFRAFNLRPGDFTDIYFQDPAGELIKLNFKQKSRTEVYASKVSAKDNFLYFYPKISPGSEDSPLLPITRTWIDPKWKSPLLIISEISTNDSVGYSITAFEDSNVSFPYGSFKVVNLVGRKIIGSIGSNRVTLNNSQASRSFELNGDGKILVTIAGESSSRRHLLYKNTLLLNENSKSLLILRPPRRNGSVKILGQLLIEYSPETGY
tara:strand:+ start:106 stop:843 length:738 start_codon:yes stop_codon:yes gene_type:complete